ncbi:hypothetical protein ACWOFR_10165 [Carnobacterium gallinarum]|uniref:hypothetical protein n=1 Tax=Carnobacterium gallinarum TaxID=2749 RepID=UPI0005578EE4|nr:hypothetical protein [Carnobacterium gallinarum]
MKKKNLLPVLLLFIMVGLIACGNGGKTAFTFDDFEKALTKEKLVVGERKSKMPEVIGAKEGFALPVNNKNIEVYQFEKGSEQLKEITKNKAFEIKGIAKIPVEVNGNYILIPAEHPDKEKIIEIFNSFDGSK